MSRIVLSIPELGVKKKGLKATNELYVISFCCDLAAQQVDTRGEPIPKVRDVINAYNETLPTLAPEIMENSALRYTYVAVSNIIPRVKVGQPASLSGSGIVLYPNLDPKGMLACHFAIVESDSKTRDVGKMLEQLFKDQSVSSAIKDLITKGVSQTILAGLLNSLVSQLPGVLKKNKDDLYFTHNHSGFDTDNYGLPGNETFREYDLGNDRAYCKLRVRINP